ncbi:MAG: RNA polymerase sigma factor [Bacteroidota bacterium]
MTLSLSIDRPAPLGNTASPDLSQESQLARQCSAGNRRAQRQLYDRYYKLVLGVCRRYANHSSEDGDLLNQAFLRIFDRIDQFRAEGPLGAWIRQVSVRVCLSALRKNQREAYQELADIQQPTTGLPQALQRLAMEDLVSLIQQLPALPKAIFNLHTVEGYTHAEIAQLLAISESNSRYHLRQARLRLQLLINRQYQ